MNYSRSKHERLRTGSVLVLVLILLSSMTVLSVGLAYRTRIELRLAFNNARRTQAYYLALGGIERTRALLNQMEPSPLSTATACLFSGDAAAEKLFEKLDAFEQVREKVLMYDLRDELGHLNINRSDPVCIEKIEYLDKALLACMYDWIDADDSMNPGGAETDFYERLEPPHIAKNSDCIALKELLYLKNMTPEIYLGEDLNHNRSLDDNERDGWQRIPSDNRDNTLDPGLVDAFTVFGDGKINVNTAARDILSALPEIDEAVVECLLAWRTGPDRIMGTDDDLCFTGAQDIATVDGLTELQTAILAEYCCFDSKYFRVFACAGANENVKCSLMATLKCDQNKTQIVYLERLQ
ncbi:MAG: general secretion pathway protein GspK [Phycisphaerales bacterium]|nr:MAG: general secretion pathway protein GspK [Phycisphaerales bacterium]